MINGGKVLDFVNWGEMNRVDGIEASGRRRCAGFRRQGGKISQPAKIRKAFEISQPLRKLGLQPAKPCFMRSANPVKQIITLMNKSTEK